MPKVNVVEFDPEHIPKSDPRPSADYYGYDLEDIFSAKQIADRSEPD